MYNDHDRGLTHHQDQFDYELTEDFRVQLCGFWQILFNLSGLQSLHPRKGGSVQDTI